MEPPNNLFELPDSTDWLSTPLSNLAPLDSALRCQVCKDFFDTPVITSCSHTFCSLCIRRCLSAEGKCPTCRGNDQVMKLRRNWGVQEVVDAFVAARPTVLELARRVTAGDQDRMEGEESGEGPVKKKRKVDAPETVDGEGVGEERNGRQTRSRNKRVDMPVPTAEVIEDSQDEEYVPEDGLVACPICNRRMKNEAVFQHLDTCTGSHTPSKQASFGSLQPMSRTANSKPDHPPERLPAINYSIEKDGSLRKKLQNLGIPDWGPKPLLQRRHTEWVNLWNANCDSEKPKSKRELLRELDIWERTQGGSASMFSAGSSNTVMKKDFDKAAWSTSNDDEYKRLIANARKGNQKFVRSADTLPESQSASLSNKPERTANLEQSAERPVTQDVQKPGELPADALRINGVDREAHQSQEITNSQTLDTPSG